jgi:hypothetical protein
MLRGILFVFAFFPLLPLSNAFRCFFASNSACRTVCLAIFHSPQYRCDYSITSFEDYSLPNPNACRALRVPVGIRAQVYRSSNARRYMSAKCAAPNGASSAKLYDRNHARSSDSCAASAAPACRVAFTACCALADAVTAAAVADCLDEAGETSCASAVGGLMRSINSRSRRAHRCASEHGAYSMSTSIFEST